MANIYSSGDTGSSLVIAVRYFFFPTRTHVLSFRAFVYFQRAVRISRSAASCYLRAGAMNNNEHANICNICALRMKMKISTVKLCGNFAEGAYFVIERCICKCI